MKAVVTTGNGGYDKLEYRAVPKPGAGASGGARVAAIAEARRQFLEKKHAGNFVLIPPPLEG